MTKAEGGRRKAEGQSGRIRLKDALARTSLSPGASFPLPPSALRLRSGVTLIELLLVVTIILIDDGAGRPADASGERLAAEPRDGPGGQCLPRLGAEHGLGEPAALRRRADVGGHGRDEGLRNCVMTLQQAEVPPPYAGDTTSASATVTGSGGTYTATLTCASSLSTLVHQGDVIQFNYEGPWYTIGQNAIKPVLPAYAGSDAGSDRALARHAHTMDGTRGAVPHLPPADLCQSAGQTHANKSVATPLQLPAGAVIDMTASGTDCGNRSAASPRRFASCFRPQGRSIASSTTAPIIRAGQHADLPAGRQGGHGPRIWRRATCNTIIRTWRACGWSSVRRTAW